MFQAPPLLKFPSLDILRRLTRGILDELLAEENEILQNRRGNLVFKQFGGGGLSQKGKRKPKVTNACHQCKKSKVGCDGHYPCDNCIKKSKQCEYPPGVLPPPRQTPVEVLPTPTELPEPSVVSHDPPTTQQQAPFAVSRFSARQQPQHYFPQPDGGVPLVTENIDTTPSPSPSPSQQQPQQQQACTDQHGHFTGDTTFFVPQRESAPVPARRMAFPRLPPSPPFLSYDIQISLIDTFYMHANPFFPAIMNKAQMREELELVRTDQHTNFSQLFFHALFSRAASLTSGEEFIQNTTTWSSASDILLSGAFQYRDAYLDSPHISTILALVIIANHLEHKKLAKNLRKAWMLIGDAGRLAIDMGLHRASRVLLHPNGQDDPQTQMCIRTFWVVCVSERTMSITYGRPSMFDDKDIDVPTPKSIPSDDDDTKTWVESLQQFVIMSNIACRIMRFNYSAQAQFPGAFRSNAAVTSVDNWMCSESNEMEDRLPQSIDCGDTKKRLDVLEALYFLSNLIQAHKPYMQLDAGTKNFTARPSFEICYLTAIMISHIAHTMPITELADLCKSPPTLYTIVKALQVHLENVSQSESERFVAFSEISFERTMAKLWILPTISRQTDDSMLTETLHYLEQKYYQRSNIVVGGHSPSRNANSPAPTLSSNGTSAMSVSSAEGTPPGGNACGSIPPSNVQQPHGWSPITFVNVTPQGKTSLGKRRSREPSRRSPPKTPFLQDQNNNSEPPPLSTSTTDINIQHYQVHANQQPYNFIPSVDTSMNIGYPEQIIQQQQILQQQQQILQQQQQQLVPNQIVFHQQLLNGQQQMIQTDMNPANGGGYDVRSMLYPGANLMPPTPVEQDPDLPSLILNDESWNLQNNYT